jgi:putative membrane protein
MTTWNELLRYQAHPDVWLVIGALAVMYIVAMRRWSTAGSRDQRRRAVAFAVGLTLLWVATDWPVDDIAERSLLSVHMAQYLVLAMIAPGLMLLGLPPEVADRLLAGRVRRAAARAASRPWLAWLVVNVVLVGSHWNPVIEVYLANSLVHLLMHIVWFASGVVLWWPVLRPLPDLPRLSPPVAIGYLFVQSVIPTIPASFLTLGDAPLFAAYERLPKPPGIDAMTDQQVAGLLMKIGGGIILWIAITIIFFRWSLQEERSTGAVPNDAEASSTVPRASS